MNYNLFIKFIAYNFIILRKQMFSSMISLRTFILWALQLGLQTFFKKSIGHIYVSQFLYSLDYCTLQYAFKSGIISLPTLSLFPKLCLVSLVIYIST